MSELHQSAAKPDAAGRNVLVVWWDESMLFISLYGIVVFVNLAIMFAFTWVSHGGWIGWLTNQRAGARTVRGCGAGLGFCGRRLSVNTEPVGAGDVAVWLNAYSESKTEAERWGAHRIANGSTLCAMRRFVFGPKVEVENVCDERGDVCSTPFKPTTTRQYQAGISLGPGVLGAFEQDVLSQRRFAPPHAIFCTAP